MIQINATLFVQMLNFIVAWKVLDKFLLRDCVKEVQQERQVVIDLENVIQSEEAALKLIEQKQADVTAQIHQQLSVALPPVPKQSSLKTISTDTFSFVRECDVSSRQQITQDTVSFLVKRITDV